jgi:hypothetical protein
VSVTIVFLASRMVSAAIMVVAQRDQIEITEASAAAGYFVAHPSAASPGYVGVLANWDGQWYWRIAEHGYSAPLSSGGHSEWAFSPLFPGAARALMELSGLGFPVAAAALATLCSYGGVLLTHRLLAERAGDRAALTACLLLCVSMASPTLQIAYTEGPALLCVTAAIWLLRRRRYLLTAGVVCALALTRPVVLPLVVVVGVHLVARFRAGAQRPELLRGGALLLASIAAVGAWPAVVAATHGRLTAFTDIQDAWRLEGVGSFGFFSVALDVGGWAWLGVAVAATAAFLTTLLRAGRDRWTPEVRTWAVVYPFYLVSVAPAATSLFRFLLLAFPLFCVVPRSVRPGVRITFVLGLTVAGLLLQWYWVANFLIVGPLELQVAMP